MSEKEDRFYELVYEAWMSGKNPDAVDGGLFDYYYYAKE